MNPSIQASADFRTRVRAGEVQVGTLVSLNSPQIAEILCDAGFDWLFLDSEHGGFGPLAAETMMQAAGQHMPCLVRIPVHEEVWVEKMLDAGAAGVIAPQINEVTQARQVVNYGKYPPVGERGVGIARAQRYGACFAEYLAMANESLLTVVQIEHLDALPALSAIAAVDGVDVLFVGPYDLSMSMGIPGQVEDARIEQVLQQVLAACRESGKVPGIFGAQPATVRRYIDLGFTLVCCGVDALFLSNSARDIREQLR